MCTSNWHWRRIIAKSFFFTLKGDLLYAVSCVWDKMPELNAMRLLFENEETDTIMLMMLPVRENHQTSGGGGMTSV